jgi:hypothetical protein
MQANKQPLSSRQILFIWIGFLVFAAGFIAVPELIGVPPGDLTTKFHWVCAALGAWAIFGGFRLRRKWLAKSRSSTNGLDAQKKWALAQVLSFAFANSIILWGFVARMRQPTPPRWFPACFYALGVILLFLWIPRNAPDKRRI